MRTNASVIGMATINLLRPAEAERIHSAISTEETTETISQAASERSVIVAAGSDSFNLVASVGFKTHLSPCVHVIRR